MKIIDIEQGSDQWHVERWMAIGGTAFQSAIGAKYTKAKGWTLGNKSVQDTLLREMIRQHQSAQEIDDYKNDAMQRGHDLEPISINAASEKFGIKFATIGMMQSEKHPMFKYSPDAISRELGVIVGGYETKAENCHIEYIMEDVAPIKHLWQCLAPMVMFDEVQWWIFGSYDDMNMINPLWAITLKREDYKELIAEAKALFAEFTKLVESEVERLGGKYNG